MKRIKAAVFVLVLLAAVGSFANLGYCCGGCCPGGSKTVGTGEAGEATE